MIDSYVNFNYVVAWKKSNKTWKPSASYFIKQLFLTFTTKFVSWDVATTPGDCHCKVFSTHSDYVPKCGCVIFEQKKNRGNKFEEKVSQASCRLIITKVSKFHQHFRDRIFFHHLNPIRDKRFYRNI
jgi:hypothetical protein